MNRFHLLAASSLLALASVAHADTVINLNATLPGYAIGGTTNTLAPSFYDTVSLKAGTYTATVIGAGYTASDGTTSVYSGWSQSEGANLLAAPGSWQERTGVDFGQTSFSAAPGQNIYSPYPNAGDPQVYKIGSGNCNTAGNCFNSGSGALAAVQAAGLDTYTFTLASAQAVTFYIPDQSYPVFPNFSDNTGGTSIDLKAVTPEPSSLILLGTGAMGLAGAVRRKLRA